MNLKKKNNKDIVFYNKNNKYYLRYPYNDIYKCYECDYIIPFITNDICKFCKNKNINFIKNKNNNICYNCNDYICSDCIEMCSCQNFFDKLWCGKCTLK